MTANRFVHDANLGNTGRMKLSVGICEDDGFTRSTLAAALSFRDVNVLFAEASPADALKLCSTNQPHAMLIDLNLGRGPSGLDLARALRKRIPEIGIVFLTSYESPRLLERDKFGLPSGSQYLQKKSTTSMDQILSAVQLSIAKDRQSNIPISGKLNRLTNHQLQVLERVAHGLPNSDIATELGISQKTLEGVIRRIVKALELSPQNSNQRVQMARAFLGAVGWEKDE